MTVNDDRAKDGRTLLIVDDDLRFRTRLMRAFEERGFEVTGAGSYDEAVVEARRESPELAIVDLRLPGESGLEVVKALKDIDATTVIVVFTGYGSIATAVESMRLGATSYMTKPADADQVQAAFDRDPRPSVPPHAVQSLARVEWEHIQRVLADCEGNVSLAARLLGIHRRSLQRKLAKNPVSEAP